MKPIPNLISILLPVHNAEQTLSYTLGSLKAQTCRDYEVVLIDDASTDKTRDLVQSIMTEDPRIHLIALPIERGIDAARSVGLDAARGQYLAFIEAEEAWDTTKLAKQREFMNQGQIGCSCTAYRTTKGRIHQLPQPITRRDLVEESPLRLSTVMIDRHVVGDIRLKPVKDQDLHLWNTLIEQGIHPIGLPEVLATCIHPNGSKPMGQTLKRRWTVARSIFHFNLVETLKLLVRKNR